MGFRAGVDGCGKSRPHMNFFIFSCTLYFIRTCVFVLLSCVLLLLAAHNTNIHAPGGIGTRNSSMRAAADPYIRPLSHWDWHRSPDRPARSESLYRLSYRGLKNSAAETSFLILVANNRRRNVFFLDLTTAQT